MNRKPFNLIVTHYPGYDNFVVVKNQLNDVLGEIRVVDSSQSILLALVDDPYKAVERIKNSGLKDTPILRVIPVDEVVDVYVDRVAEVSRRLLLSKSSEGESFRIRLDGRLYEYANGEIRKLHRDEAIRIIARDIDRPVNLTSPDWIIYVKVIKMYRVTELASITVCKPNQILSFSRQRGV